jgi:hypothetical protein
MKTPIINITHLTGTASVDCFVPPVIGQVWLWDGVYYQAIEQRSEAPYPSFLNIAWWRPVVPVQTQLGDVVECGNEVYTCISGADIPEYSHANHYYAHNNADNATPGTAAGARFWQKGAKLSLVEVTEFKSDFVKSQIATDGIGAEPFETALKLSVLNEDGTAALGTSARNAFYNNWAINPRTAEQFRPVMQRSQILDLVTYFAVNPHRLAVADRRASNGWESLLAIKTDAEAGTDGFLTIDYNSEYSNFGLSYKFVEIDTKYGIWASIKRVILVSEIEIDKAAQATILRNLTGGLMNGEIDGPDVNIFKDSSGQNTTWSGNFKDVS